MLTEPSPSRCARAAPRSRNPPGAPGPWQLRRRRQAGLPCWMEAESGASRRVTAERAERAELLVSNQATGQTGSLQQPSNQNGHGKGPPPGQGIGCFFSPGKPSRFDSRSVRIAKRDHVSFNSSGQRFENNATDVPPPGAYELTSEEGKGGKTRAKTSGCGKLNPCSRKPTGRSTGNSLLLGMSCAKLPVGFPGFKAAGRFGFPKRQGNSFRVASA